MADKSKVEWTEATWNPIAGCSLVSPGCTNCYAMERVAPRLASNPATPHYHGTVNATASGYVWSGKIGIASDRVMEMPLHWQRPRRIFVNSTSDLFHPGVPNEVITEIFAIMAQCPQHTFQVLTKRPERMRDFLLGLDTIETGYPRRACRLPLPNIWLSTSVEDGIRKIPQSRGNLGLTAV